MSKVQEVTARILQEGYSIESPEALTLLELARWEDLTRQGQPVELDPDLLAQVLDTLLIGL